MPKELGKEGGIPLKGKYIIRCKNAKGQVSESKSLNLSDSDLTIERAMEEQCDGLRNKIRVTSDNMLYGHSTIGRQFRVEFWDINYDVALFEIISDPTSPLKGKNLVTKVSYEIAPTTNLFY